MDNRTYSEKSRKRRTILLVLLLCVCVLSATALAIFGIQELQDRRQNSAFYEGQGSQYDVPSASPTAAPTVTATPLAPTATPVPTPTLHGWEALGASSKDFAAITADWADVKAWIRIPDSKIDYPVVQGEDNDYYLSHLPDGTKNDGGSIMMDVSNEADFSDAVTILHGHHMKNGSMFGDLDLYEEEAYCKAHPVIELYTPKGDVRAEVFAVFYVNSLEFTYPTNFADAAAYDAFIAMCKSESDYDTGITPQYGDTLLMLSTCSYVYDEARLLVMARLDLP